MKVMSRAGALYVSEEQDKAPFLSFTTFSEKRTMLMTMLMMKIIASWVGLDGGNCYSFLVFLHTTPLPPSHLNGTMRCWTENSRWIIISWASAWSGELMLEPEQRKNTSIRKRGEEGAQKWIIAHLSPIYIIIILARLAQHPGRSRARPEQWINTKTCIIS